MIWFSQQQKQQIHLLHTILNMKRDFLNQTSLEQKEEDNNGNNNDDYDDESSKQTDTITIENQKYPNITEMDYGIVYNPLHPPFRRNPYFPPNFRPSFYQPTRGEYGPFQQIGYLSDPNHPSQVLPLMGRKIHSNQFEYYTTSHFNPSVKIQLPTQKDEIHSGDRIDTKEYGPLRAEIYDTNISYNPYQF